MKLADIFTDSMVLQRRKPIAVFGSGSGKGRVELGGNAVSFEATDGWLVHLPAMEAGGPYTMTVTLNDETVTLTDILVGDVYLAGGQSNMQFRVEESVDIPRIPNEQVRVFTEGHGADENRNEWHDYTPWRVATAENLEKFTAIGYDVGRMLQEELHIPIGIVSCNIGASRVDAWTAPEIVEAADYQQMLGNKHGDWHYYKFNHASWCYLTKLLPLIPYGIHGVLSLLEYGDRLSEQFYLNSNTVGVLCAMSMVVNVYNTLKNNRVSWLILFLIPGLVILSATGSRQALAIFAGGLVLLLFLITIRGKSPGEIAMILAGGLLILIGMLVLISRLSAFSGIYKRMLSMVSAVTGI